MKRRIFEY
ncbi:hypothetical protein SPV_2539 [Streptococcus pneumoniae]|nr:hypothetical protein SPV_2539 [Streptococcus pneumoniae]